MEEEEKAMEEELERELLLAQEGEDEEEYKKDEENGKQDEDFDFEEEEEEPQLITPTVDLEDEEKYLDPGLLAYLYHEMVVSRLDSTANAFLKEIGVETLGFTGKGVPPRLKELVDFWNFYHQEKYKPPPKPSTVSPTTEEEGKTDGEQTSSVINPETGEPLFPTTTSTSNNTGNQTQGGNIAPFLFREPELDIAAPVKLLRGPWLAEEEERLRLAIANYGDSDLEKLTSIVKTRSLSGVTKHLMKTKRGWGREHNQRIFELLVSKEPPPTMQMIMSIKPSERSEKDLITWLEWFIIHNCTEKYESDGMANLNEPKRFKIETSWTQMEEELLKQLYVKHKGDIRKISKRLRTKSLKDIADHVEEMKAIGTLTPIIVEANSSQPSSSSSSNSSGTSSTTTTTTTTTTSTTATTTNNGVAIITPADFPNKKLGRGRWTLDEVKAFNKVFAEKPHDFLALCNSVPTRSREGVATRIKKLSEQQFLRRDGV